MYRIVIIAENFDFGASLAGWTERFFAGKGLFPRIDLYESEEKFYIELREKEPGGVIIALPGVAGLNAAEHLQSLWSECGLIWCSDLDFSLHAYRLRAEYFIKAPFVETELAEGLSRWMKNRRF